ncbi:hypothetical protein [Polaromonas sp.]|uniref:hypothetical protein n=1 Tax=Polaromonas sp. TaxID=1869339 RepID=UPI00352B9980
MAQGSALALMLAVAWLTGVQATWLRSKPDGGSLGVLAMSIDLLVSACACAVGLGVLNVVF